MDDPVWLRVRKPPLLFLVVFVMAPLAASRAPLTECGVI